MNLQQHIVKQLGQVVNGEPQPVAAVLLNGEIQPGYIVGFTIEGEPNIILTLADYDRYSVALRQVEIQCPQPKGAVSDLNQYAEQVINRLSYLEEPLGLVEIDLEQDVAQLRSHPPHQADKIVTYWEVLLHTTPHPNLTLARYQWNPEQAQRMQLDYPLTFDMLGRIMADLATSLSAVA